MKPARKCLTREIADVYTQAAITTGLYIAGVNPGIGGGSVGEHFSPPQSLSPFTPATYARLFLKKYLIKPILT